MSNSVWQWTFGFLEKLAILHREQITATDLDRLATGIGIIQTAFDGRGEVEIIVERGQWRFTKFDMCAQSNARWIGHSIQYVAAGKKAHIPPQTIHAIGNALALIKHASGYGVIKLDVGQVCVSHFSVMFDRTRANSIT